MELMLPADLLKISTHKQKCFRLIPSRFPPIHLFEDVADPQQFEALYYIQSLTNPRIQEELGNLDLIPPKERLYGIKGSGYIMAAFTHINPQGSRFSDGTFGIYYASTELKTAIVETIYHREQFLSATCEPAQEIDMRCLIAKFSGEFINISNEEKYTEFYNKNSYLESQKFGITIKTMQLNGIYYNSVRKTQGNNFAIFRPKVFDECFQQSHYGYIWNGNKITDVYRKQSIIN
jgi:hypothetical protein